MNVDQFIGRALLLKNRGFVQTINFVAWPEQMYLIPYYKKLCEDHGLRFHVDPCGGMIYPYTDAEKDFLRAFTGADRANAWTDVVRPVQCSAGHDRIIVWPDGEVFACMKLPAVRIGNLLDPGFNLAPEYRPCSDYNKCPGCDRDKVKVRDG
jgi:MoaA/NifB/PqqE/SkfB family radical SAM enzyme